MSWHAPASRRQFLARAASAVLAMALSGCVGSQQAPPGPPRPLALRPGALIRGGNIAVRSSYYPRTWDNLWIRWEWDDWIKWQIDLARTLGANGIRVIGTVAAVAERAITPAQYRARWTQFLDYLAAQGMWAYPCASDLRHWGTATLRQAAELYLALGPVLDRYPNVVGIDVSNEAQFVMDQGRSASELSTILATLTSTLRTTTSKALTHSWSVGAAGDLATPWIGDFRSLADFLDVHLYYTPAEGDLSLLSGPLSGLPVVIGEFGIGIDAPSEARTARYLAVRELVATQPRIAGALAWDIAEDNFGLFDLDGRPRRDITAPFMTFPLHR